MADAQVLLGQPVVDGCVVIAREGVTTRDQMRRARAIHDSHVVVPFGIVVTGYAGRDVYGYGYEHGAYDETPGEQLTPRRFRGPRPATKPRRAAPTPRREFPTPSTPLRSRGRLPIPRAHRPLAAEHRPLRDL